MWPVLEDLEPPTEEEVKWEEVYGTPILLDEEKKPVPQWGFMKGNFEKPYVPSVVVLQDTTWDAKMTAVAACITVAISTATKYGAQFVSHPLQLGLLRAMLLSAMTYHMAIKAEEKAAKTSTSKEPKKDEKEKDEKDKEEAVTLTFAIFMVRLQVMGLLALSQFYVLLVLPISVTQCILSMAPLFGPILNTIFIKNKECIEAVVLLPALIGIAYCCKMPLYAFGLTETYPTHYYTAIAVAIVSLIVKALLQTFTKYLRKNGVEEDYITELKKYDGYAPLPAFLLAFLLSDAAPKLIRSPPSPYLIPILLSIGALAYARKYINEETKTIEKTGDAKKSGGNAAGGGGGGAKKGASSITSSDIIMISGLAGSLVASAASSHYVFKDSSLGFRMAIGFVIFTTAFLGRLYILYKLKSMKREVRKAKKAKTT